MPLKLRDDACGVGKEIYLGKFDKPENWHEITEAEAERIKAEQEALIP